MEAVIIVDVLRRAGVKVFVASVEKDELQIVASRKVKLVADGFIEDYENQTFDFIVLPVSPKFFLIILFFNHLYKLPYVDFPIIQYFSS